MSRPIARATFDSNVWRRVASPDRFPNAPDLETIRAIRQLCSESKLAGHLSETTFTLEQVPKADRLSWLLEPPNIESSESSDSPDSVNLSISIGPSHITQPKQIQMVRDHLEDAFSIGIRILRSKRIAGPNNPILQDNKYFLNYQGDADYREFNNRNGEVVRELESLGFGLRHLKDLGESGRVTREEHWLDGLRNLHEDATCTVPDLVAEWADCDAVATSIAHDIKYFCTNDSSISASGKGINSILAPGNAQTLFTNYGFSVVDPAELLERLSN